MTAGEPYMKIQIEIQEHEGTFYATSEKFPGFLLCGKDLVALEADILPAMKLLINIKESHRKKPAKTARPSRAASPARVAFIRELAIA